MVFFDDSQPIFQQIAHMIEDDILNGTYREDDQIISMAQFASTFQVNPATVVKGIALLVNKGFLYKKGDWACLLQLKLNRLLWGNGGADSTMT
ncbi:GntR family transcriptional regulator [Paenibacillus terreus]|uniref:GntR family transcriptional regulator n=1 Tax=Paenibacillus terreus TaxID=1387834 RepID=A0ABV5B3P5_9BACL